MRVGKNEYMIIDTKYGKCKTRIYHYNKGIKPSIMTAVNKNEYFINQAREIHGDKYSYNNVNYVNAITKVLITCSIHGDFLQTPNAHLDKREKRGCPVCGKLKGRINRRNTQEEFVSKSNNSNNYKYDYSKSVYTKQHNKIIVVCPIHGDFELTAKDHMRGHGCVECGRISISKHRSEEPTGCGLTDWIKMANKSIRFDSFKCYIIRCFDNNEEFIKIGRTFNTTSWRFRNIGVMPYEYEVLKEIVGSPKFVLDKETELKNKFKDYKYVPLKKFNGQYECFTVDILNELLN